MKYCPQCKLEFDDGKIYCPNCGTLLLEAHKPQPPEPAAPAKPKLWQRTQVLAVALGVLAVAAVTIAILANAQLQSLERQISTQERITQSCCDEAEEAKEELLQKRGMVEGRLARGSLARALNRMKIKGGQ